MAHASPNLGGFQQPFLFLTRETAGKSLCSNELCLWPGGFPPAPVLRWWSGEWTGYCGTRAGVFPQAARGLPSSPKAESNGRSETALEGASELVHGSAAGRGVPVAPRVTCPGTVCVFSRPSTVRRHGKSSCQPRRATYGSAPGSGARWCAGPGRLCTVRCPLRAHGCRDGITWAKHATGPPHRGPASETRPRADT